MEASCSRFTPAEGGTRLALAAVEKNILVVEYGSFIATRLIYEEAYKIRGSLSGGRQRSVWVTRASRVAVAAHELRVCTDLAVAAHCRDPPDSGWGACLESHEVLVCTSAVLRSILDDEILTMRNINVLIIDSCHLIWTDEDLQCIMKLYKQCDEDKRPRILALTYPIFAQNKNSDENETNKKSDEAHNGIVAMEKDEHAMEKEEHATEKEEHTTEKEENATETEETECKVVNDNDEVKDSDDVKSSKCDDKRKDYRSTVGVYENFDDYEMYEKLEWKIEDLEEKLCCEMDLAEDIDGGKRLSALVGKPKELLIEYSPPPRFEELSEAYADLDRYMRQTVNDALDFINEHRYDPTEIYGEELYEEFKNIPDPTIEPKHIFAQFLYVLDELGPYAADKAAFSLLIKLEKLKIKVPYERHFLILCLCTTVFVKIRCYADLMFSNYESDWRRIKEFCTPKVIRLAEILQTFQPPELQRTKAEMTSKMMSDLEKCNFSTLADKIQDRVNVLETNLKEIDTFNVVDDLKCASVNGIVTNAPDLVANKDTNNTGLNSNDSAGSETDLKRTSAVTDVRKSVTNSNVGGKSEVVGENVSSENRVGFTRRSGGRTRGRGRTQRSNATRIQQMLQNPDALCGIVFVKDALVAKILFMLIADMSRAHPRLSFLNAQYCAVENPANPNTEPRECQRQSKNQEDVLKKFRMHECNILLATSDLEDGIDLPRCNLVLRWDVPPSYVSYGLSRSRARAARSTCGLLWRGDDGAGDGDGHGAGGDGSGGGLLRNLAVYRELDQIITRKCGCDVQNEPPESEETEADAFTLVVKPYAPAEGIDKQTKIGRNRSSASETEKTNIKSEDNAGDKVSDSGDKNVRNEELINKAIDIICDHGNDESEPNKDKKIDGVNEKTQNEINNTKNKDDVYSVNENNETESILKTNKLESNAVIDNVGDVNAKLANEFIDLGIDEKNDCGQRIENNLTTDSENVLVKDKNYDNLVCNRCSNVKKSESQGCVCMSVESEIESVEKDGDSCKKKKKNAESDIANVDLSTAIALINRYCAKLPSDTFTRLTPQWWMEEVPLPVGEAGGTRTAYICTVRMPLNCPVKYNIVGHPMPTRVLARRMVALQACRILHKSGELDNQLMPIGKENFKAAELESTNCASSNGLGDPNDSARPGTTKRRQYYYKRTAWAFTDCQPVVDTTDAEIERADVEKKPVETETPKKGTKRNMLYAIVSKLWCALPERYNTRGRRLHAPQSATQAIGILMARESCEDIQIPPFPVYTRSGEVRVAVRHVADADVRLSPRRARLVRRFMRFVFSEVLRVRRRGMRLQSEGSTHNNYYIVPTIRTTREDGSSKIDVDWSFLELIYQHTEERRHVEPEKPVLFTEEDDSEPKKSARAKDRDGKVKQLENPHLKTGETFVFDPERYREAVVTPWYRNQDQPQFFLVAEICWNLSPESAFPSAQHATFRQYYLAKYGAALSSHHQPLLDVDHTSARLNLLTPRYVNRKGVALPVSSERTRRAKRDRLDQKQILVPELCTVHPFAAPLWAATVALPCVLYRVNALLIADEIRRAVAIDVGLGIPRIDEDSCPGFRWPALDFGWSLAEVLSADYEKNEKKKEEEDGCKEENGIESSEIEEAGDGVATDQTKTEGRQKTINDILQEKEKEEAESGFEIGTWSNEMASSIPTVGEYDEFMEPLPSNVTLCTSASGGSNWCEPIDKPKSQYNPSRNFSMADSDCSYMSSDFDTDDSDLNSDSEDDSESNFWSKGSMGVRIEYKTAHEAEAVDVERKKVNPAPKYDEGDDERDCQLQRRLLRTDRPPKQFIENFHNAVANHEKHILTSGNLIAKSKPITAILPETKNNKPSPKIEVNDHVLNTLFPYGNTELDTADGQITLESIEKNKRVLLAKLKGNLSKEEIKKLNCFSMVDVDIDSPGYVNEKVANVGFDTKDGYMDKVKGGVSREFTPYYIEGRREGKEFDFDYQPPLDGHPGPSPSVILQALTMSNANDGINLERLETIGDSFLKFAITAYLYCAHPTVHEGKLSHMRSKQVSNLNLYRLGRGVRLGARMVASKFEPHDNWLPPCHRPPHPHQCDKEEKSEANPAKSDVPVDSAGCFIPYNLITQHSIPDKSIADCVEALIGAYLLEAGPRGALLFMSWLGIRVLPRHLPPGRGEPCEKREEPPPAQRMFANDSDSDTESSYSDEGECEGEGDCEGESEGEGEQTYEWTDWRTRPVGSLRPYKDADGNWIQPIFGELKAPPSPLLRYIEDPEGELERMLSGYDALERTLQYRFKDRSLLLQALTHASHQTNRLSDCYQRLEFLGDAVLDYLITRHLYEDPRRHSPGALTDLRSALVNNTIFATLAARHGFHKYFRHMSPGLNEVLTKYVKIQEENGHSISEEHYLIQEDEMEQAEDVEVPKALGDLFESVAGAIFLDSGMSLGAVWKSYVLLMGAELEAFSAAAPKSPVRELLEAEPDTAKFGKPERLADGRRVRVCVEVFGRGTFKGVGRNYRIAKGTAARCALRHLKGRRPV